MSASAELPVSMEGLKFFQPLQRFLDELHRHCDHPQRNLFLDDYLMLLILAYYNPIITGLRQLVLLPQHRQLEGNLGLHRTSLGSFSEASSTFDPELLRHIFLELADQAEAVNGPRRPQGLPEDLKLFAADATLWKLLPRMVQTFYRKPLTRARKGELKAHVLFNVLSHVPVDIHLSTDKTDERHTLLPMLEAGALYVIDRGYQSRALFRALLAGKFSFLARIKTDTAHTVAASRPLTPADRAAGVLSDETIVLLPERGQPEPGLSLRAVRVKITCPAPRNLDPKHKRGKYAAPGDEPSEHELLLVTERTDLSASDIAEVYRYRWQIEIFFRWFKCVIKCRHLFAESNNGMALQIYAALIASLLIVIYTGRKPTKQVLFVLHMYLSGGCDYGLVANEIRKLKPTRA